MRRTRKTRARFQSTPSLRRETGTGRYCALRRNISIHSLLAEGDDEDGDAGHHRPDFNPLPPCGGRRPSSATIARRRIFQSTPSLRRETAIPAAKGLEARFQSTPSLRRETRTQKSSKASRPYFNPLPPCGGRQPRSSLHSSQAFISIHSLLAEGDQETRDQLISALNFNPLPPCGGRHLQRALGYSLLDFNPLPPCGGRHLADSRLSRQWHFNPLPPCGGRRLAGPVHHDKIFISIHSLLAEGDAKRRASKPPPRKFQSTPSLRRETRLSAAACWGVTISIHSLLAEGDAARGWTSARRCRNFNPLPPCGGRPRMCHEISHTTNFNPLPPCGGRLFKLFDCCGQPHISIHSLLAEGDVFRVRVVSLIQNFNPLPPCGGRLGTGLADIIVAVVFQSTPSLRRETLTRSRLRTLRKIFQSTPSLRRETRFFSRASTMWNFNPLPPCGGRRSARYPQGAELEISIHSLLAEGDEMEEPTPCAMCISIHSLLAEGDDGRQVLDIAASEFQSTPSLRRET